MNTKDRQASVIDETAAPSRQGYTLVRVYRTTTGDKIRVSVIRDSYLEQSSAYAEVLTPAMTWTRLADEPASSWHGMTPHSAIRQTVQEILGGYADALVKRAITILS